ncbi:hypothetical protein ASJ79_29960 [Mycobacterium sp. NAZ190054]|nr:hypothetical protein ASJ79_29960 [Mycobacterium sp. NAZ190054]
MTPSATNSTRVDLALLGIRGRPPLMLSAVDLPHPLGPNRERNSPSMTSRSIPLSAIISLPPL